MFSIAHPRQPHGSQQAQLTRQSKGEMGEVREEGPAISVNVHPYPGWPVYIPPQECGIRHLLRDSQTGLKVSKAHSQMRSAIIPSSPLANALTEVSVQFFMTLSLLFLCMPLAVASQSWISSTLTHCPQRDRGGIGDLQQSHVVTAPEVHRAVHGWMTTAASWVGKVQ